MIANTWHHWNCDAAYHAAYARVYAHVGNNICEKIATPDFVNKFTNQTSRRQLAPNFGRIFGPRAWATL